MKIPFSFGGNADSDECTAVADDILEGKTAIFNGSNDEPGTGTMKDYSGTAQQGASALDTSNSRLQLTVPNTGKYDTSAKLYTSYSDLTSLGNLTASKIATGNTVFGITGTYTGVGTATASQVLSGYTFSSSSLSGASGTMSDRSGTSTSVTATNDSSNSRVRMTIPSNGYYNTSAYLYTSYSSLASVISLTASKMTRDQSCLGITGSQNYLYIYSDHSFWSGTLSYGRSSNETVTDLATISGYNGSDYVILEAYITSDGDSVDGCYALFNISPNNAVGACLVRDGSKSSSSIMYFTRLSIDSSGLVTAHAYSSSTSSSTSIGITVKKFGYTNANIAYYE